MNITPRTRSSTRLRREPTPKLSERKKRLFTNEQSPASSRNVFTRSSRSIAEEDDDSDIGPMSPLQFSSSPSTFNSMHNISSAKGHSKKNVRTNFANIINEISPAKRLSKRKNKCVSSDDSDRQPNDTSEEDVVAPLCTSMKNLSSSIERSPSEETILSGNTSCQEQNYEKQMKTPNELANTTKSSAGHIARGVSSKKSLMFDNSTTPSSTDATASSLITSELNASLGSKAKASLSFTEATISTRSFYGKPSETTAVMPKPNVETIFNSKFEANVTQNRSDSSRMKQQSRAKKLAKRMKGPSLWRFSGKMKYNRFKNRSSSAANRSKSDTSTKHNSTVSSGHNLSANQSTVDDDTTSNPLYTSNIEHNLRLQQILKDQTNALNHSRSIDWNGDANLSTMGGFSDSEYETDDDEQTENQDPQQENVVAVEEEDQSKRKFFKSKSGTSAKYRVMGRLNATLKRGGDLKLQMPKRKKRRSNKDDESFALNDEISNILGRLDSPSKSKPSSIEIVEDIYVPVLFNIDNVDDKELASTVQNEPIDVAQANDEMNADSEIVFDDEMEKYRRMIPYNTTDAEKIDQQSSILELLVVNGICNDETFNIFIAEPELHKDKANEILDSLYCLIPNESDANGCVDSAEFIDEINDAPVVYATSDDTQQTVSVNVLEPEAMIIGSIDAIEQSSNIEPPPSSPQAENTINPNVNETTVAESSTAKVFPIFQKNFGATQSKSNDANTSFSALNKSTNQWRPIGNQQLQIDAGQKSFGVRQCTQCNMEYSVHEPEDELLHLKYHNCVDALAFKGWTNEHIVTQILEWNMDGRIIYVSENDSKAKKDRVKEILEMVDRHLGFAARSELKPKTLVYIAIAKQQITGVCVAHPIEKAHRLAIKDGIDCYSLETYPVKCGISRIWVAPPYRRRGIAGKLITAVRSHFVFGCFLSFDELAFSAPTEDGKRLAASLAQRNDFLIYES